MSTKAGELQLAVRVPLRVRLLMIPFGWVPALGLVWTYIATHDVARTWRQLQAGHKVTGPPAPNHAPKPAPIAGAEHVLGDLVTVLHPMATALLVVAVAIAVSRVLHRRARARATTEGKMRSRPMRLPPGE